MANEFKVGDKVRVKQITTDDPYVAQYVGQSGVVLGIVDVGGFPIIVKFSEDDELDFAPEELEAA